MTPKCGCAVTSLCLAAFKTDHYLRLDTGSFQQDTTRVFAHLHDPGTVGEGHDVPLLPEEGRVGALDHLKFVELLHGVHLLGGLVANLRQGGAGWVEGVEKRKETRKR